MYRYHAQSFPNQSLECFSSKSHINTIAKVGAILPPMSVYLDYLIVCRKKCYVRICYFLQHIH